MASPKPRPMPVGMETPTPLPPTPLSPEAGPQAPSIVTAVDARAELRRLTDASTPGPWLAAVGQGPIRRRQQTALVGIADMRGQGTTGCLAVFAALNDHRADDAQFVAAARTAVPELLDTIARVEQLHRPHHEQSGKVACPTCLEDYPCPTIRALS